jgi:hypothetical protein
MNRDFTVVRHRLSAIEGTLWIWLALGFLALIAIPALRAGDPVLGWLPYWLVIAPAFDLALLHRGRLWATARGFLVRARRRRRPARQALRMRRRHSARPAFAMMLSRRERLRAAMS